jgi:hypothetical protein
MEDQHFVYYVISTIAPYAANKMFVLLVPRDSAQLQGIREYHAFNVQFLVAAPALK